MLQWEEYSDTDGSILWGTGGCVVIILLSKVDEIIGWAAYVEHEVGVEGVEGPAHHSVLQGV